MSPTLLDIKAGREYLGSRLLCSVDTVEKRIAFTFDDGPNPRNTLRLLELLDSKRIPASFFLVGRHLRRYESIARDIVGLGHDIGNHTFNHIPLPLLTEALLRRELDRTTRLIEKVTGERPRFVRPPMGWFTNRILRIFREMDYSPVLGNIYPQDSRRPGTEIIVERVVDRMEPGSIIILHDGGWHPRVDRSQTIEAVDRITDLLGADGYGFDTLSNLVRLSSG